MRAIQKIYLFTHPGHAKDYVIKKKVYCFKHIFARVYLFVGLKQNRTIHLIHLHLVFLQQIHVVTNSLFLLRLSLSFFFLLHIVLPFFPHIHATFTCHTVLTTQNMQFLLFSVCDKLAYCVASIGQTKDDRIDIYGHTDTHKQQHAHIVLILLWKCEHLSLQVAPTLFSVP